MGFFCAAAPVRARLKPKPRGVQTSKRLTCHLVVDGLRARPLTLDFLAAEVVERTELTVILEAEREAWGEQAAQLLGGQEFADRPELRGLAVLLVAGVQYLLVRRRTIRIFSGFNIQSEADWAELKAAVRTAALRYTSSNNCAG